MATTLAEIERYLGEEGLKYRTERDAFVQLDFATSTYVNPAGERLLRVTLRPDEEGRHITLIAPALYRYKEGPHKPAVLQACLGASWMMRLVRFDYDERDGEIRGVVGFPLEDAPFTRRQLRRMIECMTVAANHTYPMIIEAISTGSLVAAENMEDLAALVQLVGAVRELGVDEVRRLIRERSGGGAR